MSGSVAESVICLECEEALAFPGETFLYKPPNDTGEPAYRKWNWASVLLNRIWCHSCDGFRYAERIPSLREFNVAAAVRRMPDLPRPENLEDELLEVDDDQFRFLYNHLSNRVGPGHCLSCGGSSYSSLAMAIDRVVNFKHLHCGGALKFRRNFVNFVGPRAVRWYDVAGRFLAVQNDSF
jgi:hypothetical protein